VEGEEVLTIIGEWLRVQITNQDGLTAVGCSGLQWVHVDVGGSGFSVEQCSITKVLTARTAQGCVTQLSMRCSV
jgi:hypothetical protein